MGVHGLTSFCTKNSLTCQSKINFLPFLPNRNNNNSSDDDEDVDENGNKIKPANLNFDGSALLHHVITMVARRDTSSSHTYLDHQRVHEEGLVFWGGFVSPPPPPPSRSPSTAADEMDVETETELALNTKTIHPNNTYRINHITVVLEGSAQIEKLGVQLQRMSDNTKNSPSTDGGLKSIANGMMVHQMLLHTVVLSLKSLLNGDSEGCVSVVQGFSEGENDCSSIVYNSERANNMNVVEVKEFVLSNDSDILCFPIEGFIHLSSLMMRSSNDRSYITSTITKSKPLTSLIFPNSPNTNTTKHSVLLTILSSIVGADYFTSNDQTYESTIPPTSTSPQHSKYLAKTREIILNKHKPASGKALVKLSARCVISVVGRYIDECFVGYLKGWWDRDMMDDDANSSERDDSDGSDNSGLINVFINVLIDRIVADYDNSVNVKVGSAKNKGGKSKKSSSKKSFKKSKKSKDALDDDGGRDDETPQLNYSSKLKSSLTHVFKRYIELYDITTPPLPLHTEYTNTPELSRLVDNKIWLFKSTFLQNNQNCFVKDLLQCDIYKGLRARIYASIFSLTEREEGQSVVVREVYERGGNSGGVKFLDVVVDSLSDATITADKRNEMQTLQFIINNPKLTLSTLTTIVNTYTSKILNFTMLNCIIATHILDAADSANESVSDMIRLLLTCPSAIRLKSRLLVADESRVTGLEKISAAIEVALQYSFVLVNCFVLPSSSNGDDAAHTGGYSISSERLFDGRRIFDSSLMGLVYQSQSQVKDLSLSHAKVKAKISSRSINAKCSSMREQCIDQICSSCYENGEEERGVKKEWKNEILRLADLIG